MAATNEERVRARAHEIWEQEGRPEGRDREHWERAHREVSGGETRSFGDGAQDAGEAKAGSGSDLFGKEGAAGDSSSAADLDNAVANSASIAPAETGAPAAKPGRARKPRKSGG